MPKPRAIASLLVLFSLVCAGPAQAEEIIVSAAASLTNAFTTVKQRFEAAHPGATVVLNFGAAGALLRQLESGAPVDVFVSADQKFMDEGVAKNLIDPATRRDFARNIMVVVVPPDAKTSPADLKALAAPGIRRIALGNPDTTPLGRDARALFQAAGLWPAVQDKIIYGETVRQVLDYAVRGEVDAAFVFATDAMQAGPKVRVAFQVQGAPSFLYPVAVTRMSKKLAARTFVDYLNGPEGQATLRGFGFLKP
ncbi:MAG TPA: molybdate ABC transporter substrate-binding protein [Humidesulfovibrio sp.]|uniref:molybdate ABC transporter substrate-binding protein n=1 Tax=Humidesulfovibrio sp. TaxID=2910988 RepID=UPI002C51206A|nr:molybdate ABC transporter substrate-binding protein [Humidesulfovibrio sp.]HWR03394.1 molybdate ABC transporter substrate-binding protein [Humidesulfovibrio sp.]